MRFSTVLNSTTGSADSTADRVTSQIGHLSSVVATMHRKLRQAPLSSSSLFFRYYTTYDRSYVATCDVSQVELRRSGSLQNCLGSAVNFVELQVSAGRFTGRRQVLVGPEEGHFVGGWWVVGQPYHSLDSKVQVNYA